MNIIYDLEDVNNTNIFFSEKKKNVLMEGHFTKLLYSDEFLTSVGIYIDLVVEDSRVSQYQNKTFLNFNVQTNNIQTQNVSNTTNIVINIKKLRFLLI